jgi:hypothetical protein
VKILRLIIFLICLHFPLIVITILFALFLSLSLSLSIYLSNSLSLPPTAHITACTIACHFSHLHFPYTIALHLPSNHLLSCPYFTCPESDPRSRLESESGSQVPSKLFRPRLGGSWVRCPLRYARAFPSSYTVHFTLFVILCLLIL